MYKSDKIVPVIDCPVCGAVDTPLSHQATVRKDGYPDIDIWECSNCGKVPNLMQDIKVKKYVSVRDLEKTGWKKVK